MLARSDQQVVRIEDAIMLASQRDPVKLPRVNNGPTRNSEPTEGASGVSVPAEPPASDVGALMQGLHISQSDSTTGATATTGDAAITGSTVTSGDAATNEAHVSTGGSESAEPASTNVLDSDSVGIGVSSPLPSQVWPLINRIRISSLMIPELLLLPEPPRLLLLPKLLLLPVTSAMGAAIATKATATAEAPASTVGFSGFVVSHSNSMSDSTDALSSNFLDKRVPYTPPSPSVTSNLDGPVIMEQSTHLSAQTQLPGVEPMLPNADAILKEAIDVGNFCVAVGGSNGDGDDDGGSSSSSSSSGDSDGGLGDNNSDVGDVNGDMDGPVEPRNESSATSQPNHASSLLRDLTDEEADVVRNATFGPGPPDEILATSDTASVQRQSMHKLQPGVWLNDEVIHYYLQMLARRDAELADRTPGKRRCHFFNSAFISKLLDEADGYNYAKVERWSRWVPGKDIFALDKIFFPGEC